MENELNMVTGGDIDQTSLDSRVLKDYGLIDSHYSEAQLMIHWVKYSAKVDAAWAKIGITCVTCPFYANRYYNKDGKRISWEMAWYILCNHK